MRIVVIYAVPIIAATSLVFFKGSKDAFGAVLSLDSIFAGMLALAGFLFTARTFLTFQLKTSVYDDASYREDHEKFKKDGAVSGNIYGPLKEFDRKVSNATVLCFVSLLVTFFFPMLPERFGDGDTAIPELIEKEMAAGLTFFESIGDHWPLVIYEILSIGVISLIAIVIVKCLRAFHSINGNMQSIVKIWEKKSESDN